jgi:hypothetical protein
MDYDNPGSSSESNEIRTRPDGRLKRSNLRPQFFSRDPTSVPSSSVPSSSPCNQLTHKLGKETELRPMDLLCALSKALFLEEKDFVSHGLDGGLCARSPLVT